MKYSSDNDSSYSLHNVDNFKNTLTINVNVVMEKYINLIIHYLKFVIETLKIKKKQLSNFIIIRGIDTLTNVFNNILYYTKNLELTCFHCQKAYYYYIEFIEQITDEQNVFLQLNSRDAITYVYKKTIYEINNDFRKNIDANLLCKNDINKFYLMTCYTKIYTKLSYKIVNNNNFTISSITETNYIDTLENILNKINFLNFDSNNIDIFYSFIDILDNKVANIDKLCEIIILLTKKINKNNTIINNLKKNIYSDEFDEKLEDTSDKFINWITTN